jgi:hypothetical protein
MFLLETKIFGRGQNSFWWLNFANILGMVFSRNRSSGREAASYSLQRIKIRVNEYI